LLVTENRTGVSILESSANILMRNGLFITIALVIVLSTGTAKAATSVSQYGITRTWQEDRQIGQFV
jgi:hypothetical protein